jgi:SepF-like predicted cell division protein (DUF552 family)
MNIHDLINNDEAEKDYVSISTFEDKLAVGSRGIASQNLFRPPTSQKITVKTPLSALPNTYDAVRNLAPISNEIINNISHLLIHSENPFKGTNTPINKVEDILNYILKQTKLNKDSNQTILSKEYSNTEDYRTQISKIEHNTQENVSSMMGHISEGNINDLFLAGKINMLSKNWQELTKIYQQIKNDEDGFTPFMANIGDEGADTKPQGDDLMTFD